MTATKETRVPTNNQIKRLYTLATRAGLDHPAVHTDILRRYGIESTRDLTDRQYEQFTAFLQGMIRAQERDPNTRADAAANYPRITDRAGLERLFREQWPALASRDPELTKDLVEVLDCARLTRTQATISPRIATAQIQKMDKYHPDVLQEAARIYLAHYTTRDERYFFGIVRGEKRRQRRRAAEEREQKGVDEGRQAQTQDQLDRILTAAGPSPVPAGQRCVCIQGQLEYRADEHTAAAMIPCPWCDAGRARWTLVLRARMTYRVDWARLRAQVEAFLIRTGRIEP